MSWLSICFTVSRPTPTMMMIEEPPNGMLDPTLSRTNAMVGMSATAARYSEPGAVMRVMT